MQLTGGDGTFLATAQQDMFAVDTVAADQMMTSIEQIQANLYERLSRIYDLKTQAMLGDLPEAQAIAKVDTLVASGDPQSLDFVLGRFATVLGDLRQAVASCMRRYEQDDAQAAQRLDGISER